MQALHKTDWWKVQLGKYIKSAAILFCFQANIKRIYHWFCFTREEFLWKKLL